MAAAYPRYFLVDRQDLVYLKFILEAYEGMTTLSTMKKEGVLVRLSAMPSFEADTDALIESLRKEMQIIEAAPAVTP